MQKEDLKKVLFDYLLSTGMDEEEIKEYNAFIESLIMTLNPVSLAHEKVLNDEKEKENFVKLILSIIQGDKDE